MDFEDYLINEKMLILAISRISQIIDSCLNNNYYIIGKNKELLDEIIALNHVIQFLSYKARIERAKAYRSFDKTYKDNFSYDSVMYDFFFS